MDLYFVASYYTADNYKCIGLFILRQVDSRFYLKWKWSTNYRDWREVLSYLNSHFYFIDEGWESNKYVDDKGFPFYTRYLNCVMSKEDLWKYIV